MKNLSETAVSLVLAFAGLMIAYYVLGECLTGLVQSAFQSLRP